MAVETVAGVAVGGTFGLTFNERGIGGVVPVERPAGEDVARGASGEHRLVHIAYVHGHIPSLDARDANRCSAAGTAEEACTVGIADGMSL